MESAKKEKDEAARLRAKAEEDDQRLRVEFAAALVGQLDEYLREGPAGKEDGPVSTNCTKPSQASSRPAEDRCASVLVADNSWVATTEG